MLEPVASRTPWSYCLGREGLCSSGVTSQAINASMSDKQTWGKSQPTLMSSAAVARVSFLLTIARPCNTPFKRIRPFTLSSFLLCCCRDALHPGSAHSSSNSTPLARARSAAVALGVATLPCMRPVPCWMRWHSANAAASTCSAAVWQLAVGQLMLTSCLHHQDACRRQAAYNVACTPRACHQQATCYHAATMLLVAHLAGSANAGCGDAILCCWLQLCHTCWLIINRLLPISIVQALNQVEETPGKSSQSPS